MMRDNPRKTTVPNIISGKSHPILRCFRETPPSVRADDARQKFLKTQKNLTKHKETINDKM